MVDQDQTAGGSDTDRTIFPTLTKFRAIGYDPADATNGNDDTGADDNDDDGDEGQTGTGSGTGKQYDRAGRHQVYRQSRRHADGDSKEVLW